MAVPHSGMFTVSSARCYCVVIAFIVWASVLEAWNGHSAAGPVSHDFTVHAKTRDHNVAGQRRSLLAQLPAETNSQSVSQLSPLRFHQQRSLQGNAGTPADTNDSRNAAAHAEHTEQALAPDFKVPVQGMLNPDGSISSVKLLMEGDRFVDYSINSGRDISSPTTLTEREGVVDRVTASERKRHWTSTSWGPKNREKSLFTYPPCPEFMRDFIPCSNTTGHRQQCAEIDREEKNCAIATPNYGRQFKWPASRDQIRVPNVPNAPFLKKRRQQQQKWWMPQGMASTINIDDSDPRFFNGTNRYVLELATVLADLKFGEKTILALDVGCAIGNVAVALAAFGVVALSIAGESSADNGVQLVAERGYPALVQTFVGHRLPYPDQAFDMIHCAACEVKWEENAGSNLMEADRILRAGGHFLWMGPSKGGATSSGMVEATRKLCWTSMHSWGEVMVWEKPINRTCNSMISSNEAHPFNDSLPTKPGFQSCFQGFPEKSAVTTPWPERLSTPPLRLEQIPAAGMESAKAEAYIADLNYWKDVVNTYAMDFGPRRVREIRNVLDMNAGYGGFGAAVMLNSDLQWWVLNVIPAHAPDRLAVIFDRGLLGLYQDWCKPLDVYPRTFDMVHSVGLFASEMRCDARDIMHEIDRILRPGGFAIIREQVDVLLTIQTLARARHWKALIEETESGPKGKNKVLSCQKTFWRPKSGKNGRGR